MIYTIAETAATVADVFFLLWFVPRFLHTAWYKEENRVFLLFPTLLLVLQLSAAYFRLTFHPLVLSGVALLTVGYSLSLCKRKRFLSVVASGLYLLVILLTSGLVSVLFSSLNRVYTALSASLVYTAADPLQGVASPTRVIYLTVAKLTQFVLYKSLLLLFGKTDRLDKKNGFLLLFFPFFTIIGLGALMTVSAHAPAREMHLPVLTILFVLVLFNFAAYVLIRQVMEMQKKAYERKALEERLRFEQIRFEEANLLWDNTRKVQHDLKNHFTVLKSMLSQNDTPGCIAYLNKLYPAIESMGGSVRTGHAVLDCLLNTKISANKDVHVIVSGYANAFADIDDADLTGMVGNLLDNAFEAVSKIDPSVKRQVELHFLLKNQTRMILCRNTVAESVLEKNRELRSTKSEANHGLGHKIIESIAEKYGGFVVYTEKDNLFCAQIMLPCKTV